MYMIDKEGVGVVPQREKEGVIIQTAFYTQTILNVASRYQIQIFFYKK